MLLTLTETRRNRAGSGLLSLAIHTGAVILMFTVASSPDMQRAAHRTVALVTPLIEPYIPAVRSTPLRNGGGGGGGDRSPLPASKGQLPRLAPRQFTPPAAVVYNEAPKLLMEPTIVAPSDASVPNLHMAVWGDPRGVVGPPSNGTGSGGGIGSGSGGGVGSGKGPGYGPGEGGGVGGGLRGNIVSAVVLKSVEPEYSDEARKARLQGIVTVALEIGTDGKPRNPRVRSGLGLGLDERAIEAVMQWRFRPYLRDGVPVAGPAVIEVYFRIL